ncbi:MAG: redox-sensing transcriptional repressor Rex [Desulfarculales bacterium]|jgi:redox-sensing transcriptional repressor|nr:redox-sensing transcriptional repressor Rex [Desulfarculales bacterium]
MNINNSNGYLAISQQTLKRLPGYYHYLKGLRHNSIEHISAPVIARALKLNEVQVRKDLAAVSVSGGRPKTGFQVADLIQSIEVYLGYNNLNEAILVGVGQLGKALLSYQGFETYGMRILAGFDRRPELVNKKINGKRIFGIDKLGPICQRLNARIGIITVPHDSAQEVCNQMVVNGILAIWNFAPVHLQVDEKIVVQNENMAVSLAVLSKRLAEKMKACAPA